MNRPRILLVGGKLATVRAAAECGLDVVYVQKPGLFDPETRRHCTRVHLMDYQDLPAVRSLARAEHAAAPLTRVMAQSESALVVAGRLTAELGLPGNSVATVETMHDKAAMRALLNAAGLGPVAAEIGSTRQALHRFVRRHGAAVVKPVAASGSLGVRKVNGPDEVNGAWRWITSFGLGEFLVEELLTGVEVSVETFSVAGRHVVLAVTGKDTGTGVLELGHVVPADLPGEQGAAVRQFVVRVLDEVGLIDGPAHTEVMLTARGPRLVETHNRRGGGRIADLVRLVHGIDLDRLAFGLAFPDPPVPEPSPAVGAAAVRFLHARPGRVVTVTGVDRAAALEGVLDIRLEVAPGDTIGPARWSEDRCGHVVVSASDPASAARLAERAAGLIELHTEPSLDAAPATLTEILATVDETMWPSGLAADRRRTTDLLGHAA
jgi:biotin carboxylase